LEEKAWERARGAGEHRPVTGTPHDWEDWDRYHDELAEDAASLEQKIDKEAHRQAEQAPSAAGAGVGHFTPPTANQTPELEMPAASAEEEPAVLNTAYAALAVLFPPLAVGLSGGGGRRVAISIALTMLLWVPGMIYAITWLRRR
jgi:uncharacterized membrane protein YqaE (UPF0057 family)